MKKAQIFYGLMSFGAATGLVASFLQTLEKIQLLKNKEAVLPCNLNSVFNCTDVLNAPQSAVFGFPNSLLCMVLFTLFLSIGLVGLGNGSIPRKMRFIIQIIALLTLGFGLWFLWQSVYVIGALCIFCIFCFAGLLLVNAMWLRINATELTALRWLQKTIERDFDFLAWVLLAVLVGLAMVLRFS